MKKFLKINKRSYRPSKLLNKLANFQKYLAKQLHFMTTNTLCKTKHDITEQINTYDFSFNNCLIIHFEISDLKKSFLKLTVDKLDENNVRFPGDEKNSVFIVKSCLDLLMN